MNDGGARWLVTELLSNVGDVGAVHEVDCQHSKNSGSHWGGHCQLLIWLPETKGDAETTSNLTNIDETKGLGCVNYDTVLTWN